MHLHQSVILNPLYLKFVSGLVNCEKIMSHEHSVTRALVRILLKS